MAVLLPTVTVDDQRYQESKVCMEHQEPGDTLQTSNLQRYVQARLIRKLVCLGVSRQHSWETGGTRAGARTI